MKKKGAIELSIGTIVIIVLAMSMLILGMVLIKNIFTGSNQNILDLNDKVKDKIGSMFVEDMRTVVYLTNKKAEIPQNEEWGVVFGIKNLQKGTAEPGKFSYSVVVSDPNVRTNCELGERDIESTWIKNGQAQDNIVISPGGNYVGLVRFYIPESAPLCSVRFNIVVTKDNQPYFTDFFDVEVAD